MHQKCTAYKNAFGNTIHLHKQLQPLHCPETAMQVNKFTIVIYLILASIFVNFVVVVVASNFLNSNFWSWLNWRKTILERKMKAAC